MPPNGMKNDNDWDEFENWRPEPEPLCRVTMHATKVDPPELDWEWDYPPVTGSPVVDDPPLVMGDEKATGAALWCVYVVLAAVCVLCWLGFFRMVGVVG